MTKAYLSKKESKTQFQKNFFLAKNLKDGGEAGISNTLTCQLSSRIQKTLKTVIGEVINSFRKTTPAVIQNLFEKVKLSQVTGFYSKI